MNVSQRKHLKALLDRIGFEYGYTTKSPRPHSTTMEVWVRKNMDHCHELHIITSPQGLFRVMLCSEVDETFDGSNPNLDNVFTKLEQLEVTNDPPPV